MKVCEPDKEIYRLYIFEAYGFGNKIIKKKGDRIVLMNKSDTFIILTMSLNPTNTKHMVSKGINGAQSHSVNIIIKYEWRTTSKRREARGKIKRDKSSLSHFFKILKIKLWEEATNFRSLRKKKVKDRDMT